MSARLSLIRPTASVGQPHGKLSDNPRPAGHNARRQPTCPCNRERASGRMKSSPLSGPGGWARCIEAAIRAWTVR
jgi:hypothetical protein